MLSQRKPNTVFLKKLQDGKYSIDGDAIYDEPGNLVLMKLGKFIERVLCTEDITPREGGGYNLGFAGQDVYRFSKMNSILIRSQIDCAGKDSEGRPIVFEVKTRATSPIRYDILHYLDYLDYHLKYNKGILQSYER